MNPSREVGIANWNSRKRIFFCSQMMFKLRYGDYNFLKKKVIISEISSNSSRKGTSYLFWKLQLKLSYDFHAQSLLLQLYAFRKDRMRKSCVPLHFDRIKFPRYNFLSESSVKASQIRGHQFSIWTGSITCYKIAILLGYLKSCVKSNTVCFTSIESISLTSFKSV